MGKIRCPQCGLPLVYPAASAGKKARCKCGHSFRLPDAGAEQVPAEAALEVAPPGQEAGPACVGCGGQDGLQTYAYWGAKGRKRVWKTSYLQDVRNASEPVCDACVRAEDRKFLPGKVLKAFWILLIATPTVILCFMLAGGAGGPQEVYVYVSGPMAGQTAYDPSGLIGVVALAAAIGAGGYFFLSMRGKFRHGGMVALRGRAGKWAREGYRYFGEGTLVLVSKEGYGTKQDGRSEFPFYDQNLQRVWP